MNKKTFSIGGIHPDDAKISAGCAIEALPIPEIVHVSMAQHLGAPATPCVAVGDTVLAGQVIAEPAGFISAYIHSPFSGTVQAIAPRKDLAGKNVNHISIKVEGQDWVEGVDLSDTLVTSIPTDPKATLEQIRKCGIVGLGGATFPSHVKLNPGPGAKIDCLIINGAECEPYLTSDYRIMIEKSREVAIGAAIMQMVLGGCRCVIGIESNKPEAIRSMRESIASLGLAGMEVAVLKKKYPQGGEKQLVDAVLKRQIKSGALPASEGAVIQNVTTSFAVYEAVQKNKPLVSNFLTVTGDCLPVEMQHNYKFYIGTPLSFIAEYAGGIPEGAAKIISGGPMMGKAISNMDATTVKGSSSILYLSEGLTRRKKEGSCIRCGRCADACPMGLEPFLLRRLYSAGDLEGMEAAAVHDCIECGCCLYSCPANIPLLDYIRLAKGQVMAARKARSAKK